MTFDYPLYLAPLVLLGPAWVAYLICRVIEWRVNR